MQAEYLEEGLAFSNMHKHVTWACERQPLPSPLFWYNRLIQNVLGSNLSNKYNTDGLWKFELFKLEEADIEKFCKVLLYKTATPDKAGKHCAFQGQLTQGIANHVCGLGCKGTALYPQPSCDHVLTDVRWNLHMWFWWPLYCHLHYKPLAQKLEMIKHTAVLIISIDSWPSVNYGGSTLWKVPERVM